jgi:hypothetical protein
MDGRPGFFDRWILKDHNFECFSIDGSRKPTILRKTTRGWVKKTHLFENVDQTEHRFTPQRHDIETKFGLEESEEGLISLGWLGCDNIEI